MVSFAMLEGEARKLAAESESPEMFIEHLQIGLGVRNEKGERLPILITPEERSRRYFENPSYPLYKAIIEWLEASYPESGWFYGAAKLWKEEGVRDDK